MPAREIESSSPIYPHIDVFNYRSPSAFAYRRSSDSLSTAPRRRIAFLGSRRSMEEACRPSICLRSVVDSAGSHRSKTNGKPFTQIARSKPGQHRRLNRKGKRFRSRFLLPILPGEPSIHLWEEGKRRSEDLPKVMREARPHSKTRCQVRARVVKTPRHGISPARRGTDYLRKTRRQTTRRICSLRQRRQSLRSFRCVTIDGAAQSRVNHFFKVISVPRRLTLRIAQAEVEVVEPPAQPCKTESEFDSLPINHKGSWAREECIS